MELSETSTKGQPRAAFKQTEAGLIPSDWGVTYIRDVAIKVASGKSLPEKIGEFPVYGSTGVIGSCKNPDYSGLSVLVARVGANAGKLTLVDGLYGVTDNAIIVKLNSACFLEYFWRQLESKKLNSISFGSGQPLVTGTQIKELPIPTPVSMKEQQAIAAALTDTDALIESLEQLLAKKRQIKQGAMQELLTGKRRLPGFEGEWVEKSLGDLFKFSGGFTASRDQLGDTGYCYLHYGDIHGSNKTHIDISSEKHMLPKLDVPLNKVGRASLLEDGDVVFVDASEDDDGTSKHVAIVNPEGSPYISGLHTIVAKSATSELDNLYKRYVFQTRAVKSQFRFFAVGTKVSGISKTNIGKITVFIRAIAPTRHTHTEKAFNFHGLTEPMFTAEEIV